MSQREVRKQLSRHGSLTVYELKEKTDLHRRTVQQSLNRLEKWDLVKSIDNKERKGRSKKWVLK